MGVDWDLHLLSPLHGVFGDEHEYRPATVLLLRLTVFLTVAMRRLQKILMVIQKLTPQPNVGVRDAEFRQLGKPQPAVSDRVFIKTVGGQIINQLFVVSNVEPGTAMADHVLFSMW